MTGSSPQSRAMSLIEAVTNVAVGYGLALGAQLAIFPLFGVRLALRDNALIGALFTLVSLARAFALRRLFERLRR